MTEATQKKVRTWFEIIIGIIVFTALAYFIFFYKKKPEPNPNDSLIQYLQADSKHKDSLIAILETEIKGIHKSDSIRERQDSVNLSAQNRLSQSIQNIQSLYESIPTYRNLSHDSLRRIHASKFGE